MNTLLAVTLLCALGTSSALIAEDTGAGVIWRMSILSDTWIEEDDTTNHDMDEYLQIGEAEGFKDRRILIRTEDPPPVAECEQVAWAKMFVYFVDEVRPAGETIKTAPGISRTLEAYQINVRWNQDDATDIRRTNSPTKDWEAAFIKLSQDNTEDAGPQKLSSTTVFSKRPQGFIEFDVTSAVMNWMHGEATNQGIMLKVTSEKIKGSQLRFISNEEMDNSSKFSFILVSCSNTGFDTTEYGGTIY